MDLVGGPPLHHPFSAPQGLETPMGKQGDHAKTPHVMGGGGPNSQSPFGAGIFGSDAQKNQGARIFEETKIPMPFGEFDGIFFGGAQKNTHRPKGFWTRKKSMNFGPKVPHAPLRRGGGDMRHTLWLAHVRGQMCLFLVVPPLGPQENHKCLCIFLWPKTCKTPLLRGGGGYRPRRGLFG